VPGAGVPTRYAPWHFLYFFPLPHGHGSPFASASVLLCVAGRSSLVSPGYATVEIVAPRSFGTAKGGLRPHSPARILRNAGLSEAAHAGCTDGPGFASRSRSSRSKAFA
jgi:hypothetical protein